MAVNSRNGEITVWDLRKEPEVAAKLAIPYTDPKSNEIPIRFTGENSLWVLVKEHNELQEWDHRTAMMIRKIPVPRLSEFSQMKWYNKRWHLRALSERNYLGMNYSGEGILVDLESGKIVPLNRLSDRPLGSAISPDEHWLALCRKPGKVDLWDARTTNAWTEEPVAALGGILTSFKSVEFSQDSTRIVASSVGEEAVKIWEMSKFQELVTLPGEGSGFSGAAFSPNGNALGAVNGQGVIHIWQAPSWEEIADREEQE